MFTPADRTQVRDFLVRKARADAHIIGAAFVGSSAQGEDRWSDLDLTFGIGNDTTVPEVLERWTADIVSEFNAAVLFDLPVVPTIYRVFLFPGALQVDLSFSPVEAFGARGPRFETIFGEPAELPWRYPASAEYVLGMGIHHVVRAHICIQRGRLWQAEYWIHQARDNALTLACLRRDLDSTYGRGFDQLPPEVLSDYGGMFPTAITLGSLRDALALTTTALLDESRDLSPIVEKLQPMLNEICQPSNSKVSN